MNDNAIDNFSLNQGNHSVTSTLPKARRWYDQDPLLIEVLNLLREFPEEVRLQAEQFVQKIEKTAGKETIEAFYQQAKPAQQGKRWYDSDPAIAKAVELLRILPPEMQRSAAQGFLNALKQDGLDSQEARELRKTDPL